MKNFASKNKVFRTNIPALIVGCFVLLFSCVNIFADEEAISHKISTIKYKYDNESININQEIIESHVQLKEGTEFSSFLADASIKALYASGLFENVAIRADEAKNSNDYIITILLTPRVRVGSVDFVGNKRFKPSLLIKKITTKPGMSLSQGGLKSDTVELMKFYNEKGYPYAEVSFELKEETAGKSDVVFSITEREKFHVGKICFPGNDVIKPSELLNAMQTKKWTLFAFLKKSGIYRPEDFSADINALRTIFKNHGYLDVEIDENKVIYKRRKKTLDIDIPVNIGQQYFVGDTDIEGNNLYETAQIEKLLSVKTDDAFSPAKIDDDCENIRDFYGKSGYINTRVSTERKLNLSSNRIDLKFSINESEKCFVGEIEVRGNPKTKNKVILRELSLAPGDAFDIIRMKNSRAKLMNTGCFSQIDISPVDTNIPERKNIRIDVKEANTGTAGAGGGISTGGEIVGFLEFRQRNFDVNSQNKKLQGGGQRFRSRLQIGKHTTSVDINFEEPWWYDRELAIGADLFLHKMDYGKSSQNYSASTYNETRLGAELYLRKRVYELWEGKLAYHIEDVYIYGLSRNAPMSFVNEKGHTSVSKIIFSLERDSRDDFLHPTSGSKVTIDTELAGGPCFGETKYLKIGVGAIKHWLIFEPAQQVFSLIGNVGTIMPYGGDTTPFFDRFYLGGQNFMKGFKSRDIGPKENGTAIGGNTFAYSSAEYCFRLTEYLRFYLFAEIGFVNESKWNFSTKRYNTDAGFGLKISIMGMPLRLDFGFPIHAEGKGKNKHGMRFNYSFGVSF